MRALRRARDVLPASFHAVFAPVSALSISQYVSRCRLGIGPRLYDLCHSFLHAARVKITRTCENRTQKRVRFSITLMVFYSCKMQKRETKSDTSGHCLLPPFHDSSHFVPVSL